MNPADNVHPVDPQRIATSKKKLRRAIRIELELLWSDLDENRRNAIRPGTWTIGCENVEYRIKKLTRLVGATPWMKIPITLMELGIYQRIHVDLGVDAPVDMDQVAETRRYIEEQSVRRRHG